jgi:hypothetical protein
VRDPSCAEVNVGLESIKYVRIAAGANGIRETIFMSS